MKTIDKFVLERLKINKLSPVQKLKDSDWEIGTQGTEINDNIDVIAINMDEDKKKKYGFLSYNEDTDTIYLMSFDNIEDLHKAYGVDYGWEELENVHEGEYYYDNSDGSHYFRVW